MEQDSSCQGMVEFSAGEELHDRTCSVVCALNFNLCLLHIAKNVARYFKGARAALKDTGGIFVMDPLGGLNAQTSKCDRHNDATRVDYG
jgi:hypothetical protein